VSALARGAVVACLTVALAGCQVDVKSGPFVEPDTLGEEAAESLAVQVDAGITPTVDCGEERVYLEEGMEVPCRLSVEGDEGYYDVWVTITSLTAQGDFDMDIRVGDERKVD